MTFEEAEKWEFNPFDLTKVWPQKDFPLKPVGRMVLDRNPKNYFAEVEQSAFSPANLVPGIEPSPDKMLQVISPFFKHKKIINSTVLFMASLYRECIF